VYEGPIQDLIDELSRLPGIGPKSAQRLAFYLVKAPPDEAKRLAELQRKYASEMWGMQKSQFKAMGFTFLPVIAVFAIATGATLHWEALWILLAIAIQTVLLVGVGLIVAPLVVFFRDLERAVKLTLRFLFYASPIIYSLADLPPGLHFWAAFNPLAGIFSLYRAAFFPNQLDWYAVGVGAAISLALLGIGLFVFSRVEHAVLKEI